RSRSFTRSRAGPRARIRDITRTGWTNRDNSGTRGAVSRDKWGRAVAAAPAVAAAAPAIAAAPAVARDDHLGHADRPGVAARRHPRGGAQAEPFAGRGVAGG